MKAKKDKQLALELVEKKLTDPTIKFDHIASLSGYTRRQCIRFTSLLKEKDMNSILKHGNSDKSPSTTASDQEISCLRQLKKSYPTITIAQFRDIYLEDIIYNKKMKTYVYQENYYSFTPVQLLLSLYFQNFFGVNNKAVSLKTTLSNIIKSIRLTLTSKNSTFLVNPLFSIIIVLPLFFLLPTSFNQHPNFQFHDDSTNAPSTKHLYTISSDSHFSFD